MQLGSRLVHSFMDINLGDVVRLRKKHPCGNDEWRVVGLGVDIRIQCLKCQRHVLLERSLFERRVRALVSENKPKSGLNDV